jgi:hypothetical protein
METETGARAERLGSFPFLELGTCNANGDYLSPAESVTSLVWLERQTMDYSKAAVLLSKSLSLAWIIAIVGCGGSTGPQGGPRVTTVAVTGVVKVDGAPAPFLRVVAVPVGGVGAVPMESAALTDANGAFGLSTYESGDGVPPGQYQLTFVWGQINLMNSQYSGDKFNGKYADPAKSEHNLTVTDSDEPHDLGVIELSSAAAKK